MFEACCQHVFKLRCCWSLGTLIQRVVHRFTQMAGCPSRASVISCIRPYSYCSIVHKSLGATPVFITIMLRLGVSWHWNAWSGLTLWVVALRLLSKQGVFMSRNLLESVPHGLHSCPGIPRFARCKSCMPCWLVSLAWLCLLHLLHMHTLQLWECKVFVNFLCTSHQGQRLHCYV